MVPGGPSARSTSGPTYRFVDPLSFFDLPLLCSESRSKLEWNKIDLVLNSWSVELGCSKECSRKECLADTPTLSAIRLYCRSNEKIFTLPNFALLQVQLCYELKGSSDPNHSIFEINVGKSRIRHRTTLNFNKRHFQSILSPSRIQFQSRSLSDPTFSDIYCKNIMALVWRLWTTLNQSPFLNLTLS